MTGGAGAVLHNVWLVKAVMRVTGLTFLVDRLERDAVAKTVFDNFAKFLWRERPAAGERFVMTLGAISRELGVTSRNLSGVEKSFAAACLINQDRGQSANDGDNGDETPGAPPWMDFFVIAEIAFVAFGDLLLRSARCGHGRSVIKERHERVPRRDHDEQERKRNVHEEPAVQPVLHFGL